MNWILAIAIALAAGLTLYALARGVIGMAQGKDLTGATSQQWMRKRVLFQAIAIVLVALILILAGSKG